MIHSIEVRVQNMQYIYLIFRSMVIDAPSIFTKLYEIINVEIYTYKSGDTERTTGSKLLFLLYIFYSWTIETGATVRIHANVVHLSVHHYRLSYPDAI